MVGLDPRRARLEWRRHFVRNDLLRTRRVRSGCRRRVGGTLLPATRARHAMHGQRVGVHHSCGGGMVMRVLGPTAGALALLAVLGHFSLSKWYVCLERRLVSSHGGGPRCDLGFQDCPRPNTVSWGSASRFRTPEFSWAFLHQVVHGVVGFAPPHLPLASDGMSFLGNRF